MSEQEVSPQDEEKVNNEKKLRKREKKLRERLQEAERAQADALERLRRAEASMRKRMARVQQLEERLNGVHQHLGALQAPRATVITMITAGTDAFAPLLESPSAPHKSSVQDQKGEVLSEAATESIIGIPSSSSLDKSTDEGDVGTVLMMPGEVEPHYLERFSDAHIAEEGTLEEDVGAEGDEEESTHAEVHLEEVLLEQELKEEDEGDKVEEEEGASMEAISMEAISMEAISMEAISMEAFLKQEEFEEEDKVLDVEVQANDVGGQAQEARAVAEAAEEAARDAIERVAEAEEYLEQLGSARHLMQELERLHAEAARAKVRAQETKEAALIAEQHLTGSSLEEEQREIITVSSGNEAERTGAVSKMNTNDIPSTNESGGHPSELEVAQVEEIEEEEENLETVAAMIIADAAGIAAVRAEAVAEACSARTREARQFALKVDQALETVRRAIRMQKLTGEGAEVALKAAEREATYAHAALADAEAAEERALNAAMNAEAEAEVAEGMAFASSSRSERDEKQRNENASLQPALSNGVLTSLAEQDEEDDDDTLEVPAIRPQQG